MAQGTMLGPWPALAVALDRHARGCGHEEQEPE